MAVLDKDAYPSYAVEGRYKADAPYHHVYRTKYLDVAIDIANQNQSDMKRGKAEHRVMREDDRVAVYRIGGIST